MALRKIIYIEDELLRKKSRPVEKFDEKLHKLLDDMAETMYNANGVGAGRCPNPRQRSCGCTCRTEGKYLAGCP